MYVSKSKNITRKFQWFILCFSASSLNIVEVATVNGNFQYLVKAIFATNQGLFLGGSRPLTVFAPSDAAFAKLPAETLNALFKPENERLLMKILLYHVVGTNLTAADIEALNPPVDIPIVTGQTVHITKVGKQLKVNDANIVAADVFASNGIIHVIDSVLIPPNEDIFDTAQHNGNFQTLVTAIQAADFTLTLKSRGPFTFFAPTDYAFAKLPPGTITNLLKPENQGVLIGILGYHVVDGNLTAAAINALNPPVKLETFSLRSILITKQNNNLKVNNATIIVPDILSTNGVIHAIDQVLLPPGF